MAIFHCNIQVISRGKGKSAVAAAAYRSGETITNEYDGITHDYTQKGGIVFTEVLLPDHAPREYQPRYRNVTVQPSVTPIPTVKGQVVFFRKERRKNLHT